MRTMCLHPMSYGGERRSPEKIKHEGWQQQHSLVISRENEVIAAVRAKGFKPTDDNEADAIALLLWAIETRGGVR